MLKYKPEYKKRLNMNDILLGVNVDHIATLRQARGTNYPDPVYAASVAEHAGGESLGGYMHGERLADTCGGKGGEKEGGWVAQARDLPPPTPGPNRWSFSSLLDA